MRYVDDTLVLAKPSDIPIIFQKQIKFTHEQFIDNNDVHFLDIKMTPSGTTIYRKSVNMSTSPVSLLGAEKPHG
jgi:hypothetical protein